MNIKKNEGKIFRLAYCIWDSLSKSLILQRIRCSLCYKKLSCKLWRYFLCIYYHEILLLSLHLEHEYTVFVKCWNPVKTDNVHFGLSFQHLSRQFIFQLVRPNSKVGIYFFNVRCYKRTLCHVNKYKSHKFQKSSFLAEQLFWCRNVARGVSWNHLFPFSSCIHCLFSDASQIIR